jgi:putative transposase
MTDSYNKVYLFVHVILTVHERRPLLKKPVRVVLFPHIKITAEEKLIRVLKANGTEDHAHFLLQVHPSQNLSQVVKLIKTESSSWLNQNKILEDGFEWQENYAAYSVSPGSIKQVMDYIDKQEEYHKTKTLENELEVFDKIQIG